MKQNYSHYLEAAISMARAAGDIQLEYFRGNNLGLDTKLNSYDVVTAADKECENLITSTIREKFPLHGIIAEESGEYNSDAEWRWVVDPLDGTTNFSQGLPVFSVSVALEHHCEPVVGVVYAPYLGELFHAAKGTGAFMNGKPVHCSVKSNLAQAVLATGIPYDKLDNPDNNLREVTAVAPLVRGIRRLGSAAVDMCYVAAGFFDAYWELNLKRWDVAAGKLIAAEAGAMVSSIRENRNHSLLVSAPWAESAVKELLSRR